MNPEGGTLAYLVRFHGHQILAFGGNNYIEREIEGLNPDVVLVGAGPSHKEIYDYTGRLMRDLHFPALVLPTHWDNFTAPYDASQQAAIEAVQSFVQEVNTASPKTKVMCQSTLKPSLWEHPQRAGVRSAVLRTADRKSKKLCPGRWLGQAKQCSSEESEYEARLQLIDGCTKSAFCSSSALGSQFKKPTFYPVGMEPQVVVAADFNNDGILDLATADFTSEDVSILIGKGNGTFRRAHQFSTTLGPSALAVGDFNGDGNLDIAVTEYGLSSSALAIFLGREMARLLRGLSTLRSRCPMESRLRISTGMVISIWQWRIMARIRSRCFWATGMALFKSPILIMRHCPKECLRSI